MNRRLLIPLLLSLGLTIFLAVHFIIDLNQVHRLTIAAGSKQGESYILSQAIAQVIAKHEPKIQIQLLETKGTEENIQLLEDNKAQLATAQADIPTLPSARLICNLFSDAFQLIVTDKSGIQQVADLKGKRIALPPQGGGQYQSFWLLAQHYRLVPSDFTYKAISEKASDAAFRNQQVDAVFRVRPPGNQSIQELVQNSGGRLVPIDQAAAMKINEPAIEPAFIPKGAYQGNPPIPATDLPTVTVQRTLLASKVVDGNIIRQVTSILYEYRQELTRKMSLAANISPPQTVGGTGLPLHRGATAYYDREKPNFIQENAEYLGLILTVVLLLGSWFWQLKAQIEKIQKNRGDDYNQDIVQLLKQIETCSNIDTLESIRAELLDKFEKVVESLDKDRITPESFQSFTFTWEAAMSAMRDRKIWLTTSTISRLP
ncbi:TAXI family TRAP transporter solute-binding subunit [Nostocaceae cyanobacterium CENA357]|uniref:TAXI family TRAP transporter solute-binding subunit n=1 Tax=Atlanticothrix silvestris CENA357 TaxID=1725252 RepID=A0A8J7HG62_9CYAN|nr:TAXI family TRAP transporter solute-binding subunit [Atlanticothrix silvestris]MBH8552010.1 TAXI family TRAP transporter solute-binding subunit [Atlanticothrix silvestris CENA357]